MQWGYQQHTTVSIELSGFLSIYSSRRTYGCVHITQLLHHRWRFSKCLSLRLGFPGGSVVKNSPVNAGDTGSIPRLGRSPEGGNGNLHQYFCLENSMDRGAWWATVHGVTKSWTQLSMHARTHTHICLIIYWISIAYFTQLAPITDLNSWVPSLVASKCLN